ncbi:acyl-CoA dehydrogenase family protein [Nocardioides pacificus]
MDQDDLNALSASIAALLGDRWGDATSASAGPDLAKLWSEAAANGWFDLAESEEPGAALDGVLAGARELGRVACPLPLVDGYVASRLVPGLCRRISSGELRVVVARKLPELDEVRFVEAGGDATHVLLLPGSGAGQVTLHAVAGATATSGLAVPAWWTLTLAEVEESHEVDADALDEALVVLRLGLAARAAGAAERAHELAVEHARNRVQFGKPIGAFQAVQQRAAACQIDVTASQLLLDRAAEAHAEGGSDARLSAELAVEFVDGAARRVQFGAHHTLAAIGYFEEHPAPWLFRRVHADLTRLPLFERAGGRAVDVLVEGTGSLPGFALDETGERFRAEVREAFDSLRGAAGPDDFTEAEVVPALAERGWFGFGWPEEYGGRRASLSEQIVLHDEMAYHRVPAKWQLSSVMLLGSSIMLHGTEEQKQRFFPLIRAGRLKSCLGYSEPAVGSDLASLATRAERDGDDWVINGQKIWTTNAHVADYVWLATRTDTEATPRHAGITMFLVPMDTPGITVHPMTALSGEVSSSVFYDDVRVPDSARVGDVNGGWKVITDALAGERVVMGGIAAQLQRQLDDLLVEIREDVDGHLGPRGSAKRARLGEVIAGLQATRALVAAAIGANAQGSARLAGPMAGVIGGELAETWGEAMLDIFGPVATLDRTNPAAPAHGDIERALRVAIMYVVGGGTNDIQRGLIARGLGLK